MALSQEHGTKYLSRRCLLPLLFFASILVIFLSSCAPVYKSIEPDSNNFNNTLQSYCDSLIEITWQRDILLATSNHYYARRAKKYGITLVFIQIRNISEYSFIIPDHLLILNEYSEQLIPLNLDEAGEVLIDPVTDRDEPWIDFGFISDIFNTTTDVQKVASHLKLSQALVAHYIELEYVDPGEELTGYIAVPADRKTAFTIERL